MIKDDKITVIPKNQYDQIEPRRKYYLQSLNIIRKEILYLLNDNLFWYLYSMHPRYCMHKYKKGIKEGMICGKRIDIVCTDNKGKYRCYKHVSKTIYSSDKRKDVNIDDLCIGKTKYGKQILPCKNKKQKNNFCNIHYIENIKKKEESFTSEINTLYNIDIDIFEYKTKLEKKYLKYKFDVLENRIKRIDINYHLNQKDKILYNNNNTYIIPYIIKSTNIFYDTNCLINDLNELDIKYNSGICL